MSDSWDTKDGPRRVRRDPPTVEEAVVAAQGLTEDLKEQIEIVVAARRRRRSGSPDANAAVRERPCRGSTPAGASKLDADYNRRARQPMSSGASFDDQDHRQAAHQG
jgi:hypothetical protein